MTEAFWWYLLAGFIVGFILSTIWEWLYFRRKRMRIENRRIAELEAMLRSYTIAQESQTIAGAPRDNWVSPPFDDPGAYLDIEDAAAVSSAPPADLPPVTYRPAPVPVVSGEIGPAVPASPPPSTLPEDSPGTGAQAAATVATVAAVAAAGTMAANREEPPAAQTTTALQAYSPPRSSAFPTAAAQATSAPGSAGHTIPKGVTAHDTLTSSPPAAFPSAAAQPAPTRAPSASATAPAGGTLVAEAVAERDDEDRNHVAALAAAGTVAAVAATQQATTEAEQTEAEEAEALPAEPDSDRAEADTLAELFGEPSPPAALASSTAQDDRAAGKVAAATTTAVIAREVSEKHRESTAGQPYANGHRSEGVPGVTAAPAAAAVAGTSSTDKAATGSEPITAAKIDALVASIHELIDAVNQDRTGSAGEAAVLAAAAGQLQAGGMAEPAPVQRVAMAEPSPEPTVTTTGESSNRAEEALILLVRSIARFIRQLQAILRGADAPPPQLLRRLANADLTQIDGMKQQHIERLRVAGITSPADLARLSESELRMMLLTPGEEAPPDYSALLARAAEIAAGEKIAL